MLYMLCGKGEKGLVEFWVNGSDLDFHPEGQTNY